MQTYSLRGSPKLILFEERSWRCQMVAHDLLEKLFWRAYRRDLARMD